MILNVCEDTLHPIKSSFCDEVTGGVLSKVKRKLGLQKVSKMWQITLYHCNIFFY
ncbi:uncharacterized protein LOC143243018 isoform X2 [Tachypleus tridentatus]|uniref:uncharacterized protein LOC143243018 isoform X2 n=1 Tax=Tachypleus tridentatus TaxID=6853 RepID=UPI003FD12024